MINRLFIFSFFLSVMIITGCDTNATHQTETPHVYYYYPKLNVYFDSSVSRYIYFDSSKKEWKEKDRVVDDSTELGKKVRLDTALNPVWTNNADHRTIYSVALYSSSEDLKEEKKKVTVKSTNEDTVRQDENVQPERKRKGLGKLLNKVFGKKKKDR